MARGTDSALTEMSIGGRSSKPWASRCAILQASSSRRTLRELCSDSGKFSGVSYLRKDV